jgi:hypothetical protein
LKAEFPFSISILAPPAIVVHAVETLGVGFFV